MHLSSSRFCAPRSTVTRRCEVHITPTFLALLCACGLTHGQRGDVPAMPAAGALPGARPCVSIARIERSEVVDSQTIRLHLIDGTIIRSHLPSPCHGLKMQGGFAFRTSTDQLCELDVIHVLPPSGGACALGTFTLEHLAPGAEAAR